MAADGTIRGDLVVRGTGDPTIGTLPTSTTSMTAIAEALWQQGVRRIDGRVIGDDDVFADEPLGEGWAWDDVPFTYSAPVSPLIYNENAASVAIVPGAAPGTAASASLVDRDSGLTLDNALGTGPADSPASIDLARAPGSSTLTLSGTIAGSRRRDHRGGGRSEPDGLLCLGIACRADRARNRGATASRGYRLDAARPISARRSGAADAGRPRRWRTSASG